MGKLVVCETGVFRELSLGDVCLIVDLAYPGGIENLTPAMVILTPQGVILPSGGRWCHWMVPPDASLVFGWFKHGP